MLKAIIVDDEKNARFSLNYLINTYCDQKVKIVFMAESVKEALMAINDYKPDIVFLDIQMKGETGFDFLNQLENIDFAIIFTTAFNQYAIHAIKFSALDYLLKPIDITELQNAIDKVLLKTTQTKLQYQNYVKNNSMGDSDSMKLAISTTNGLEFITVKNIIYCKADKGYTFFYLKNKDKLISSKNLKHFEEILIEHNFFRIHKSSLINLKEINKYNKGEGGSVTMSNGDELDVSKRKKAAFLSAIIK